MRLSDCTEAWAISPGSLKELADNVSSRNQRTGAPSRQEFDKSEEKAESWREYVQRLADEQNGPVERNGFLVQPVRGIIVAGADAFEELAYGMFDLSRVHSAIDRFRTTPGYRGLVFNYDTPGGYSIGVEEAASMIRAVSSEGRPVASYSSGMCCSAGYWLAAGAPEIYASPSALIGSIGVFSAIYDFSERFEQSGIKVTVHRSGDLKGMGVFGKEYTKTEHEWIKASVDKTWASFKGFVNTTRPNLPDSEMRGQAIQAKYASTGKGAMTDYLKHPETGEYLLSISQLIN